MNSKFLLYMLLAGNAVVTRQPLSHSIVHSLLTHSVNLLIACAVTCCMPFECKLYGFLETLFAVVVVVLNKLITLIGAVAMAFASSCCSVIMSLLCFIAASAVANNCCWCFTMFFLLFKVW